MPQITNKRNASRGTNRFIIIYIIYNYIDNSTVTVDVRYILIQKRVIVIQ